MFVRSSQQDVQLDFCLINEKEFHLLLNCFSLVNVESTSASSGDDYAGEISGNDQKLTRAQRKRLRKSKLKEAASQRRKIIGPLLPASNDHNHEAVNNEAEGVRQNDSENVLGQIRLSFGIWISNILL